jgi:hypothetical protein
VTIEVEIKVVSEGKKLGNHLPNRHEQTCTKARGMGVWVCARARAMMRLVPAFA